MTLNHLHLHVQDVKVAEDFYREHFGFAGRTDHGHVVILRDAAGFDLALVGEESPAPMPQWFHFGFRLDTADAVHAKHDALAASGVRITRGVISEPDMVSFRCADPDGHLLEIYWE